MFRQIRVQGSHYQCGEQIGAACSDQIRNLISACRDQPPPGLSWPECLKLSEPFIEAAIKDYPYIIQELDGCAAGAGVDKAELYVTSVDELWAEPVISARHCSDIVVCPPTATRVLIGHNNDLLPGQVGNITAVEWHIDGQPAMFTVGPAGIYTSVGINAAGISLTGSELSSNDNRIGVPGVFIARAILSTVTYSEALDTALNPHRASSYNNIICTARSGSVVDVEGSATDHELIYPENGHLIHTNHYLTPRMQKFEGHPDYVSSIARQKRLEQLMEKATPPVFKDQILAMLRDHGEAGIASEDTVCRHGSGSETTFAVFIDLTGGIVEIAVGHPCRNEFREVWHYSV